MEVDEKSPGENRQPWINARKSRENEAGHREPPRLGHNHRRDAGNYPETDFGVPERNKR